MRLSTSILSIVAAASLLAACETAPNANGGANGAGGVNGANGGAGGAYGSGNGELAQNVGDRIYFDYDSSVVRSDAQETLQKQADWLRRNPSLNVTIEGHCDERGTREYNLALGERRATAGKNYLVSLGIDASRIQTISYGKERPAVVGSDESAWSQNRRDVTVTTSGQ